MSPTLHYNDLLKKNVEQLFGKSIHNSTIANELVNALKNRDLSISVQTIRRFWKLIDTPSKDISISSKDILCRYIGYNDFQDFTINYQHFAKDDEINTDILLTLFNNTSVTIENVQEFYNEFMEIFISFIYSKPSILKEFVTKLHKNGAAMECIMGHYQCYHLINDPDFIKTFRLFYQNATISHHTLYGECLEGIACIFRMDYLSLQDWVKKINIYYQHIMTTYPYLYPLNGGIIGLFYVNAIHNGTSEDIAKSRSFILETIDQHMILLEQQDITKHNVYALIRTLVEILIWANEFDLAYELVELYDFDKYQFSYADKTILNIQYINTAYLYIMKNEFAKAKTLLQLINEDRIRFDRKEITKLTYNIIRYKLLSNKTTKNAFALRSRILQAAHQYQFESLLLHIDE